jgi:hypothetical protein
MNMKRFSKFLSSLGLCAALIAMPTLAFAQGDSAQANTQAHVGIDANGIVHVIDGDVTSVSGTVINAVTTLGNTVMNWVVDVSAATNITVDGHTATTTAAIAAGDKINFTGMLSGAGSTMTVAATKVGDLAGVIVQHFKSLTVSSVNAAADSFTANVGKHTITVQGNASTTVMIKGATSTIAALQIGDKAKVAGTTSTNGSVITASSVVVKNTPNHQDGGEDSGLHLSL